MRISIFLLKTADMISSLKVICLLGIPQVLPIVFHRIQRKPCLHLYSTDICKQVSSSNRFPFPRQKILNSLFYKFFIYAWKYVIVRDKKNSLIEVKLQNWCVHSFLLEKTKLKGVLFCKDSRIQVLNSLFYKFFIYAWKYVIMRDKKNSLIEVKLQNWCVHSFLLEKTKPKRCFIL